MEIQKHLFKISQRALKSPRAPQCWRALMLIMAAVAAYCTLALIFGHTLVLPNNKDLSLCLQKHNIDIKNDSLYFVNEGDNPEWTSLALQQNKTVMSSAQCTIIVGKDYSYQDEYMVNFGWDYVPMFMDRQKRNEMNYENITLMLKQTKPIRSIMFNFDNLIANQILDNPLNIFLHDDGLYIKSPSVFVSHVQNTNTIWTKIYYLGKVILCFTVISIVTTLYIYGTIVAAPAVIIFILKCCNTIRGDGITDVYKLFPWIGTHSIIRDTSTNPTIKESASQICKAMLLYFFFLYLVYYSIIIWIDKRLYQSHIEMGLQELVFGFIAVTQFLGIIYMRTRSFIKYYPPIHCLLMVTLLYYGQVCDYGFKKLLCFWAFSLSVCLFSWMVIQLQIPAHTTWDPNLPNTPREDRPRAGYFPLFSMGWIKNLPEEWTLMMPLFSRQHFSTREMALVDHNHEELALALGNR